jgi:hypothetical protein
MDATRQINSLVEAFKVNDYSDIYQKTQRYIYVYIYINERTEAPSLTVKVFTIVFFCLLCLHGRRFADNPPARYKLRGTKQKRQRNDPGTGKKKTNRRVKIRKLLAFIRRNHVLFFPLLHSTAVVYEGGIYQFPIFWYLMGFLGATVGYYNPMALEIQIFWLD